MELEVSFNNNDVKLVGTLELPEANTKKLPAFVLIPGSGPMDRNENPDLKFLSQTKL